MNLSNIVCRGVAKAGWCVLFLALCLANGCGPKPAAPPAPAKPKTNAAKAGAAAPAETNLSDEYTSVFEDLPPPRGKDPFFPYSHRRDQKIETPTEAANAHVDPVLVLKAIIRTIKHSQAVINNEIFEEGETQSVRVPNGRVKVRCLKIGKNFVEVQVEGEAEPKRLMMEQKKY